MLICRMLTTGPWLMEHLKAVVFLSRRSSSPLLAVPKATIRWCTVELKLRLSVTNDPVIFHSQREDLDSHFKWMCRILKWHAKFTCIFQKNHILRVILRWNRRKMIRIYHTITMYSKFKKSSTELFCVVVHHFYLVVQWNLRNILKSRLEKQNYVRELHFFF